MKQIESLTTINKLALSDHATTQNHNIHLGQFKNHRLGVT